MQKDCPVIFLAFANDDANYLYKLTEEQNAIRQALKQMEKAGLCEVVYETDTDLDKIWATFNEYQERIAIFHYGGHAEDYALLLEKANGEQQLANGEGLVSFLAEQKGLQLIFINGCCSKRQAEELRDRGVPVVVGTSEPINDETATVLSAAFYRGLAAGRSLEQAWLGAKNRVLSQKKKQGFHRGIKLGGSAGQYIKDFPWEFYVRPGAENIKDWNLPRAAHNPLFALPLPEEAFRSLPPAPYIGLHYFQEKDAALFFGRGVQIRKLYNYLQGVHPIILLYGKSGVGKSSMLGAGLIPRIKDKYEVCYLRRNDEKGLLGTLREGIDQLLEVTPAELAPPPSEAQGAEMKELLQLAARKAPQEELRLQIEALIQQVSQTAEPALIELSGLLKKWQLVEQQVEKPLLIILDQVEEKFTRPKQDLSENQEDELLVLLHAIEPLFSKRNVPLKGKLILSYRKEYHPEIRDAFRSMSLPYAELFLKRLNREGIIEAVRGVTQHDVVEEDSIQHSNKHNPYRLELEQSADGYLPEIIADDLTEDPDSPIAPVLQITLQKLWRTAAKQDGEGVRLSIKQYRTLRKQGTTMGEFFQQQMEKLSTGKGEDWDGKTKKIIKSAVQSGLVLDILYAHTTELGTADSCRQQDLLERYAVDKIEMELILGKLQEVSLLNRSELKMEEGVEDYTYYLAHDTLAPAVILAYNLSNAPCQRAARILKHKMADIGFRVPTEMIKAWEVDKEDAVALSYEYIGLDKFFGMVREILGTERFKAEKENLLQQAQLNFLPEKSEILLSDAELLMAEVVATGPSGTFSGMQKLTRPERELLLLSQKRRDSRLEAARKAQEEKEKLIKEREQAFRTVKEQKAKVDFNLQLAEKSKKVSDTIISKVLITDEQYFHSTPELLSIGIYDTFVSQQELQEYLQKWHADMGMAQNPYDQFRNDLTWIKPQVSTSDQYAILYLQLFLVDSGFLQPDAISGIFGYETLSGVRQFQEYNLVWRKKKIIPNGTVDTLTWKAVLDWKAQNLKSDYNSFANVFPSQAYTQWLELLRSVQWHYQQSPNAIYRHINSLEETGGTRKVADWNTSVEEIHLLCIRRNETNDGKQRTPDDLFVLLIKGQAFVFWGSTDPRQMSGMRQDEAYLTEGQHLFRFGWHKGGDKSYRAINSKKEGSIVFRDRDNDDKLTAADIEAGPDQQLNYSIPIHWTGIGRSNWSAGSLVIAGKSYLNHHNEVVDCTPFAATDNRQLRETSDKTQGAFNSLLDLVTILSDRPDPDIVVTLINEKDLYLSSEIADDYAATLIELLMG